MTFGDHLDELRTRLLLALIFPIPVAIITFSFSDTLINWLRIPHVRAMLAHNLDPTLQALGPAEVIVTKLKLSIIAAIIVSAPWLLWQAWRFIAPGLYVQERRFVHFLIPGSAILTASGIALMYWVMLPLMLFVLVSFGTNLSQPVASPPLDARVEAILSGQPDTQIRTRPPSEISSGDIWLLVPEMTLYAAVAEPDGTVITLEVLRSQTVGVGQSYRLSIYISFVLLLFLGIVIAFQMPLVIVLLGWMGLAQPSWFHRNRKYALLICAILSALLTPADVVSMIVMLIPLYGLYELGILLLRIAPASAVAEGTLRPWRIFNSRSTDKATPPFDQSNDTAQTDYPSGRTQPLDQFQSDESDGKEDE